ncbi:hypothetical protein ACP4OV_031688 [Aristida adscensionis]
MDITIDEGTAHLLLDSTPSKGAAVSSAFGIPKTRSPFKQGFLVTGAVGRDITIPGNVRSDIIKFK